MIEKFISFLKKTQDHPRVLIAGAIVLALIVAGLLYLQSTLPPPGAGPTTFGECAALYKVTDGFPRTCSVPWGGRTFVEYTGNQNKLDTEIRFTDLPPAPVLTASPFIVNGEALPEWFAGAGLTAQLVAGEDKVIGSTTAQASTAPAGAGYKAFTVSIPFTRPAPGTQGALIFKSGGSSAKELIVPVVY